MFSPGRRTGVFRARSAMKARSASTGPSKRRTRSTGMPASWATSSAEAPARIRAWMSRGRRWLSTSISIWPRRARSLRTAARSRSSIGSVYSVLSAALSTSRVPSLETATTRSSGMGTSRVVPADVTCVAASASRVWPARVQPATTLPSCPACRAWALDRRYGTVTCCATLSDDLSPCAAAPVRCRGAAGSSASFGPLPKVPDTRGSPAPGLATVLHSGHVGGPARRRSSRRARELGYPLWPRYARDACPASQNPRKWNYSLRPIVPSWCSGGRDGQARAGRWCRSRKRRRMRTPKEEADRSERAAGGGQRRGRGRGGRARPRSSGVYGTILGAGVVSVVATCGGSVFQHFFRRTGEQIREVRHGRRAGRSDGRRAGRARDGAAGRRRVHRRGVRRGHRARHPDPGLEAARARRGARSSPSSMAGITTYELVSGNDLSGGQGTTVGSVVRGGAQGPGHDDPAPSVSGDPGQGRTPGQESGGTPGTDSQDGQSRSPDTGQGDRPTAEPTPTPTPSSPGGDETAPAPTPTPTPTATAAAPLRTPPARASPRGRRPRHDRHGHRCRVTGCCRGQSPRTRRR